MNNQVKKTSFKDLLTVWSTNDGSTSSNIGCRNVGTVSSASNGFHNPTNSSDFFDGEFATRNEREGMNPAFSGCNGRYSGPNPFSESPVADPQTSQNLSAFNLMDLSLPSQPSEWTGPTSGADFHFNRVSGLDREDSFSDFLDNLANTPPPSETTIPTTSTKTTLPMESFPCASGYPLPLNQHPGPSVPPFPVQNPAEGRTDPVAAAVQASGIDQVPIVEFVDEPGDVQFRYPREIEKRNVSPIWADGAPRQVPTVKVSNMPQNETFTMELALLDENKEPSIHKFYRTKGEDRKPMPSIMYTISHDQTVDLENIGILRTSSTDKRGDNELHNSVILGVRLLTSQNWQAAYCVSKVILDIKKIKLRIDHINPHMGFNSSNRKEVTILCSKTTENTEVHFEVEGCEVKHAEVVLRHHGYALVVRPPYFPDKRENFTAKVKLYCRLRNRYSEPKSYRYDVDALDSININAFAPLHASSRDRSPLRNPDFDGVTDVDGEFTAAFESLTLDGQEVISKSEKLAATLRAKMADLQKIRDVACGKEAWGDEAKELLSKSPYILHVQDSEGFTPPMRCLLSDETKVFENFLACVNDSEKQRLLTSRTCGGATFLHMLAVPSKVSKSLLEMMLTNGADPVKCDENGQTVIHWLVRKQRVTLLRSAIDCLQQFFRSRDEDPKAMLHQLLNRLDNNGQAAIHCAVLSSTIGAIDVLVTAGASVDLRCPNSGLTALHWAIIENNAQAVDALIGHSASVTAETNWGAAALDIANQSSETLPEIKQSLQQAGATRASSARSSEDED